MVGAVNAPAMPKEPTPERALQKWEPVLRSTDMQKRKVRPRRVTAHERDAL